VGPVAGGRIERNQIAGLFVGTPMAGGSAVLLIASGAATVVEGNDITADTDVGINVVADQAIVANNKIVDAGDETRNDAGIVNSGIDNVYVNNTIVGFRTPQFGVEENAPPSRRLQQIE